MNNILQTILGFINATDSLSIRKKLRCYHDRDLGIRQPDTPAGFLVNSEGLSQIYSGGSMIGLNNVGELISSNNGTRLRSTFFKLETDTLSDISICGRRLNPSVATGIFMQVLNKEQLNSISVITPETSVSQGKIVNSKPLSELVGTGLLLESNTIPAPALQMSTVISKITGEVPKIISKLTKEVKK